MDLILILLQKMKWALLETTSDLPFVTSDNFMNVFNPRIATGFYSVGLGMRDACVHVPISKALSLLMVNSDNFNESVVYNINHPPSINNNQINLKELIKTLNKKIYCECNKYVFSNSDSPQLKRCFDNLLKKSRLIEANLKEKGQG